MKNIIKNIENKRDLDLNIPAYINGMYDLYSRNSSVRMSMNLYTFNEMAEEINSSAILSEMDKELKEIITEGILNEAAGEQLYDRIFQLRNRNNDYVNGLTVFTDVFSLYEHIINRCEYNFIAEDEELMANAKKYSSVKDEDVTRKIMNYIFSEKDNVVINERITTVVSQLPVRMTKAKFFQYLLEAFKLYKDQDLKSLENFIYILKTNAVLDTSAIDESYDKLYDIYKLLSQADYSSLTKAQYDNLRNGLDLARQQLEDEVSKHMLLQENINDLLVILITNQYLLNSSKEYKHLKNAVDLILSKSQLLEEELTELYMELEGVQEDIYEELSTYDYLIDDDKNLLDGCSNGQLLNLKRVSKLSSGSLFVPLDEKMVEAVAAEEVVMKAFEDIVAEFEASFKTKERIVNRARMGITMGALPVFFNNISEVQDYVYDSLNSCTNEAEKIAVKEILLGMTAMEEC